VVFTDYETPCTCHPERSATKQYLLITMTGAKSKDPDSASMAMQFQGVLSMNPQLEMQVEREGFQRTP
jgi:hypothetical protein